MTEVWKHIAEFRLPVLAETRDNFEIPLGKASNKFCPPHPAILLGQVTILYCFRHNLIVQVDER